MDANSAYFSVSSERDLQSAVRSRRWMNFDRNLESLEIEKVYHDDDYLGDKARKPRKARKTKTPKCISFASRIPPTRAAQIVDYKLKLRIVLEYSFRRKHVLFTDSCGTNANQNIDCLSLTNTLNISFEKDWKSWSYDIQQKFPESENFILWGLYDRLSLCIQLIIYDEKSGKVEKVKKEIPDSNVFPRSLHPLHKRRPFFCPIQV